jgi:hypothetical protein
MGPTILIAGVVVPVLLHLLAPQSMPWWPDTISMGIAFGVTAGLVAMRFKKDREMNRRLWQALKTFASRRA